MFVAATEESRSGASSREGLAVSPRMARSALLVFCVAAAVVGALTGAFSDTAGAVGDDLAGLLRSVALVQAMIGAGVIAGVWWRLGAAVRPGWLLAYALSCGALAAGPGLIWSIVHVEAGAVLLYGGFLAGVLLLWRDKAAVALLTELLARRKAARRT